MQPSTLRAIAAILETDATLSQGEKSGILIVCQSPKKASLDRRDKPSLGFVTPREAADILHTSLRTVWRLARLGKLRRVKIGSKSTRFRVDDVENITSIDAADGS